MHTCTAQINCEAPWLDSLGGEDPISLKFKITYLTYLVHLFQFLFKFFILIHIGRPEIYRMNECQLNYDAFIKYS